MGWGAVVLVVVCGGGGRGKAGWARGACVYVCPFLVCVPALVLCPLFFFACLFIVLYFCSAHRFAFRLCSVFSVVWFCSCSLLLFTVLHHCASLVTLSFVLCS